MNANLMDRRELAALVFKDDSLQDLAKGKFEQKDSHLHSVIPSRDVHTLDNVVETFCRVENELERLNPLGLIEQEYMPEMPPSRHVQRLSTAEAGRERISENSEFMPIKTREKVVYGQDANGKRVHESSSCVIKPKTANLPAERFRKVRETTFVTEVSDPPDYGEDPLHVHEEVSALLSEKAMRIRPSAAVQKMRQEYHRQVSIETGLPPPTPDILLENAMPTRSRTPSRTSETRSNVTECPVAVEQQRSISPNARKILEKELYAKSRKVENEMLARVEFRELQNAKRVNETRNMLRLEKQRLTDEIAKVQKELEQSMASARLDYTSIQDEYAELLWQSRAAQPVHISPEFSQELVQLYSDFSSLSAFWQTRGECGCLGCMNFLGMDRENINYAINQFLLDNREEEELEKIRRSVALEAKRAEEDFFRKGVDTEREETHEEKFSQPRRPTSAITGVIDARYLVVPCGCSICEECCQHAKKNESKTCPVCYQDFQQLVKIQSSNACFGGQLIEQLGRVLLQLRVVSRCIGELGALDFAVLERETAK